jgi:hypothetical protein
MARPARSAAPPESSSRPEALPLLWAHFMDACGVQYVHDAASSHPHVLCKSDPGGRIIATHASMRAFKARLRRWAAHLLWQDRVTQLDVRYALRTGDDAFLQAELANMPPRPGPSAGAFAAHERHRKATERPCHELTEDDLAHAARLDQLLREGTWNAVMRWRWTEALEQRARCSADALDRTFATTAATPPGRRRL